MSQRDQGQHRSKGMLSVSCGCMLLVAGFLAMSAQVQAEPPERVRVLVHLDPDADRGPVRAFAANQGGFVKYEYTIVLPNVMNLRDIPVAAVAALEKIPGVARVEEDQYHEYVLKLDESTPLIRGLQSQITGAGYSADGTGIRVCVVDTGIDGDHIMYYDRIDTAAGWDFYNDDSNPEDDNGHGAHVAGIAVGRTGLVVTHDPACAVDKPFQGVAPAATLIGVKVLNRFGGGFDADIIAGINHCADPDLPNGRADVMNLSIGTGAYSGPCTHSWAVAANDAVAAGVVVIAASGNENQSNAMCSPACGADVIAVGATWKDDYPNCEDSTYYFPWTYCTESYPSEDDVTCFSNESDYLDVTAPGAVIWSASTAAGGGNIKTISGTSQACPHVVGLAALVLDMAPSLTPAEVRQIIRDGAIDLGPAGFDRAYGYGRIDVLNTLALIGCDYNWQCDDGLYCNGAETCVDHVCQPGTAVDCNDGVGCTDDSCNETTDSCDNIANDANCDNGLYCDGAETCHVTLDCQPGTAVDCNDGVGCTDDSCNETTDSCDNVLNDSLCDNGLYCDGAETCHATLDCQSGTAVDCDDAVGCTDDSCNDVTDTCDNIPNDANCPDDGLYCNGTEYCDAINDCDSTGDPCGAGEVCNEVTNTCDPSACDNDGTCEPGEDCHNCPNDCFEGSGAVCGNGVCETADGEDCASCPDDCNSYLTGAPGGRYCCGDGTAKYGVTCDDPRCTGGGNTCTTEPAVPSCCGDGVCEGTEDVYNCAVDCGCTSPEDCDDANECTVDDCVGGVCENTPVADDTPCAGGICCDGTCDAPVCSIDDDCTDSEACTTDTCLNPDTCSAECHNTWPACGLADDCCGPDCTPENDPDCESCLPRGAPCTEHSECCSLKCLGNGTCK